MFKPRFAPSRSAEPSTRVSAPLTTRIPARHLSSARRRNSSIPSACGMCRSRITTVGSKSWFSLMNSSASPVVRTSKPSRSATALNKLQISGSSSMISSRFAFLFMLLFPVQDRANFGCQIFFCIRLGQQFGAATQHGLIENRCVRITRRIKGLQFRKSL